jgi:hypothetical protein
MIVPNAWSNGIGRENGCSQGDYSGDLFGDLIAFVGEVNIAVCESAQFSRL